MTEADYSPMKTRVAFLLGVAGVMLLLCAPPFAFALAPSIGSSNQLQHNIDSDVTSQNTSTYNSSSWGGAPGEPEKVIYRFTGGDDGSGPNDLVADSEGNLYGTTFGGGPTGAGVVFRLSPPIGHTGPWVETILYTFSYRSLDDGIGPKAGLVIDHSGNLFGSTWLGGPTGGGLVFELSPPTKYGADWSYQVIYGFSAPNDGSSPEARLAMDGSGNLYGTTVSGGTGGCAGGCGIVFELAPPAHPGQAWTETILYNFPGHFPGSGGTSAGVTLDSRGDVYGTSITGGGHPYGTVFRLSPPEHGGGWSSTVLYAFKGGADGAYPMSGVVFGKNGNLYGTTAYGGSGSDCFGTSCGTVFELTPAASGPWSHQVLYTFAGGTDGGYPASALVIGGNGNLFGTTQIGGDPACDNGEGCGTIFRLHPMGALIEETILHRFSGGDDGVGPGGLILGPQDNLYGVAGGGEQGAGLVLEVLRG